MTDHSIGNNLYVYRRPSAAARRPPAFGGARPCPGARHGLPGDVCLAASMPSGQPHA